MKFCSYHNEEHDESDFNNTQLKRKNSAWCRAALAENKRLKENGIASNSKATGKGGRPRWDTEEDRIKIQKWLKEGQSYSWIGRQYNPIKQPSVISLLAKKEGWESKAAKELKEPPVILTKVCTQCKKNKPIDKFNIRADRIDYTGIGKYYSECTKCQKKTRKKRNKEYYAKHQQKRALEARERRARDPEKANREHREYEQRRREDPERQRHWQIYQNLFAHGRRLQEKEAGGFCTVEQWEQRVKFYGDCCYICERPYYSFPESEQTIEHVIPVSKGGTNWPSNLRPACKECNLEKWANMPTLPSKFWYKTSKGDQKAREIADRHYSRKTIGAKQFVQPGRSLVLTTENYDALWVSMWPYPEYVRHQLPNSWFCQIFRNESKILSSKLIEEAVGITTAYWDYIPSDGFITFIDPSKIKSNNPGYSYKMAGFINVGKTQAGLIALQLSKKDIQKIIKRTIRDRS